MTRLSKSIKVRHFLNFFFEETWAWVSILLVFLLNLVTLHCQGVCRSKGDILVLLEAALAVFPLNDLATVLQAGLLGSTSAWRFQLMCGEALPVHRVTRILQAARGLFLLSISAFVWDVCLVLWWGTEMFLTKDKAVLFCLSFLDISLRLRVFRRNVSSLVARSRRTPVVRLRSVHWDVKRRWYFAKLEPLEWYQLFLNWQDLVHKRLHVNGVEQDCENLRSGNGEQLGPNETELAARDVEDLIAAGVLLTDTMW